MRAPCWCLLASLATLGWTNVSHAQASTAVACENRSIDEQVFLIKPHRCAIDYASQTFGFTMNLRGLRWHAWGGPAATTRGLEGRQRVRVRAWRPRMLCGDVDGTRVYTRVRVRSRAGVVTVRQSACPDSP